MGRRCFLAPHHHRLVPADLRAEEEEGASFKPLAYTKTFAMAAALLSVTVVPALMVVFVRGRIVPEHRNPLNLAADRGLPPVIRGVLRAKTLTVLLALVVLARASGRQ